MTRRFACLAALIGATLFAACFAPARAVTEFCPARVTQMRDPSSTPPEKAFPTKDVETATPRSTFTYTLDAQTPRTIAHATMIADTDDGWYGWHVENIPLAKTSITEEDGSVKLRFTFARSVPIVVTFPKAVVVHHAWVTVARTAGETLIGWDAFGDFACEVPDFPDGGPGFAPVTRRQASTALTSESAPTPPPGVAVAVAQPFPMDCDVPFKRARTTRAKTPEYPVSAADDGSGYYVSLVEVAVGDDDRLIDAWVYATSGNSLVDLSALRSARISTFSSAVSYCQHVRGYYLFRADFDPH